MVVRAAQGVGTVVTNDIALGRRARTLGCRWLPTADLFLLGQRTSTLEDRACRAGIEALHRTGRITLELRDAYMEELS